MEQLKVGLQLYSIRQAMTEDMDSALAKVKAMGYDYVEFSGGRYGRTAAETRALLDKHALSCISVHQSSSYFENDPADAVDYVKTLGAKFCVIPVCRLESYLENWDATIALFQRMTTAFREAGIQLLYHNHDHEVGCLPGDQVALLDRILDAVPGLQPEFDTCWLSYGGADPVAYIQKYAPQLGVVHLKDYQCTALDPAPIWQLLSKGLEKPQTKTAAGFQYAPVGSGVENWQTIIAAIRESAAEYVVVEQDESKERTPLEAVEISRNFLRKNFCI